MRVLLIKAMADGHLYSQFGRSLQRALLDLGHEAHVSGVDDADGAASLACLLEDLQAASFDAVVSFSSFLGGLTLENGASLFDALGVKFVGWQFDHPVYAPQSLAGPLQNRCAIYAHPSQLWYAQAIGLPGRGMAMLPGAEPPAGEPMPYGAREWGIFVAATWNGEPQAPWRHYEDGPTKRLLRDVLDHLLSTREPSVLEAFEHASAKSKLGLRLGRDRELDQSLRKFFCEALTYVRHRDRIATVRALVDAGLPVTICGDGWADHLGERSNVTFLQRASFADLPALYGNSRVVLNLNGANGGCERAINAALAGAAVLSDHSEPLDRMFGAGRGIAFFNRVKPTTAANVAVRLLAGDGEQMARAGHEKAARSGLWSHRAQQLVDFIAAP
jgi:hypothetical protein